MRVGLVGCVKTKLEQAAPAAELYTSPLFTGRRKAVERSCDQWFVLSALHGLVRPDEVLEPYDRTLLDASSTERRRWSGEVLAALRDQLGDFRGVVFEIHAGATYTDYGLAVGLKAAGAEVELPMRGLRLGEQLSRYRSTASFERDPIQAAQERRTSSAPRAGRYTLLRAFLESVGEDTVTLAFDDIEELINAPLPASAYRHRPWWANHHRSPQGAAWMAAGYEVDAVDRPSRWVRFRRGR
jgi:hypothetical protein